MTLGEFIERTGFDPTAEEFNKIAESYYQFDGDAEAFCKDFVENHRDRDYYIARAVKSGYGRELKLMSNHLKIQFRIFTVGI